MKTALTTFAFALSSVLCFSIHPAWAVSTMFNFESGCGSDPAPFDCQEIISGPGVFSDVEFNKGSRYQKLRTIPIISTFGAPGPNFSPSRSAKSPEPYFSGHGAYRADFKNKGVNFVSVVVGDAGGDADYISLAAYDENKNRLSVDRKRLKSGQAGGVTLAVNGNGSDISYVVFGSWGVFHNSVSFDNFMYGTDSYEGGGTYRGGTYNNADTPIPNPEPSSLALMGTGLLGLLAWRMKSKRTHR